MLYDPKWEVKTDPFSLESLITWLEKQPGEKAYCFFANGGCMLHQYFEAMKLDIVWVGGLTYETDSGRRDLIPNGLDDIAAIEPHTFGAALNRARSMLPK